MRSSTVFYILTAFIGLVLTSPANAATAELQNNSLPASGRQETLLNISGFGRYALISQSTQGTALRYINKMSGPSKMSGAAGAEDGRIDTFLDVGEYKLVTYASDQGSGEVDLSVMPFTELNDGLAPQLIEHKLVSEQLGDFQQRSYWIHIKSRQTLLLEAAGRSLGDLRLWRDGNWLLDVEPWSETIEPEVGKPLTARLLSADLNPGLYLLTAYGGKALPWSETSDDQPFHLRMGIPSLAGNGIDQKITSPFGYDRWLVPASTDYYRLELKKNAPASIEVTRFERNYKFLPTGRRQNITKESRIPVAEVRTSKGRKSDHEIVTIAASAGQPYIFQRFSAVRHRLIRDPGTYWVSTLHSGYGEDSADATSILTDYYRKEKYVDSRAIALSRSNGWQRRFNILDTLTLFFEVEQQGNYRVEADGIQGQFRFEPFTTFRGNNYRTPKARRLGNNWQLDRGFYILTVIPERDARGVATLSVYAEGRKPVAAAAAHIASRYQSVRVKSSHRYKVYLNQQPGVVSGILVRKYPIDLRDSMPLTLNPGESLSLVARIPANGELVAQAEDGSLLKLNLKRAGSNFSVKAETNGNRYPVESGRYQIDLHNPGQQALNYQLEFTDASQLQATPLPDFDLNLVRRPDFPELNASQPHFLDLKKKQWTAFNVIVDEPGLYKLETTGLLETRGNIRTRVITQLDQQSANGSGRNFLIQQYLREGEYQLALSPQGETEGHLGVQLNSTALIDGGRLDDGVAARYSLPSGQGLVYRFEIRQAGRYRLQSFGSNGYFSARLEDSDGWPLLKPGLSSNFDLELHAGEYRLVVLPTALPARVVTRLKGVKKAIEREGHGPFAMDLNQSSYAHTWLEPESGGTRHADIWTFSLPAAAETSLSLSEGMEASLVRVDANSPPLKFSPLKPLKQTLAAGRYRIEARASRKNNRLNYSIGFVLKELLVGQQRSITAPFDIDISIGRDSLIELSSFGEDDVKARLFDADDRLLASNDDRDNDWNFNIIQSLPAGQYRLKVSPVGKASAQTSISLAEPQTLAAQALDLPGEFSIASPLIHRYTLDLSASSGVLAVAAESRDSVSLTLEKQDGQDGWVNIADGNELLLASIDNPSDKGNNYRLSIWSPEQRGAEIIVSAQLLKTPLNSEAKLSEQTLLSTQLVATRMRLVSPGMFKTALKTDDSLFWASKKDRQLRPYDGFISSAEDIWLVSTEASKNLQASRILLKDSILQFNVDADTPAWVDSQSDKNAYQLLVAESRVGLPGVAVLDENSFDARRMGVGLNSTMALAGPQSDNLRIRVWDSGDGNTILPVRLRRYHFDEPVALNLQSGSHDATLQSHTALAFELAGRPQDIRFSLPQGVAAALFKKGKLIRSFWPDRRDRNYQIWSDADRLMLFNTREQDRVLTIKLDNTDKQARLSPGRIFKQHFPQAGVFALALSSVKNAGGFVEVYGQDTQLVVQNQSGQVSRGQRLPLGADANIDVAHGAGLVVIWLNNNAIFSDNTVSSSKPVPVQTALKGAKQTIVFERDKAGFINLQSATPLIARFQRNGLRDRLQVFESGMTSSMFLPTGVSQLHLEPTTAQDLSGVLRVSELTPVELQEGLGSRAAILPGDARVYRFSLPQSREIGLGVQASLDLAQAYLFNQQGELLGEGVSQMHSLSPGDYYLMIELPAQVNSAIDISPAIVGLESRDTGASKDIMLDYQQYSSPEAL